MSSHESNKLPDELDALFRYSLRASVGSKFPPSDARRRLLGRAAHQQRRKSRGLAALVNVRAGEPLDPIWQDVAWNHVAYFNLLRNFGFIGAPHYQIR